MPGFDITQTPAWAHLLVHHEHIADAHMRHWFEQDHGRFARMHERLDGMLVDFSKNRITDETLQLLTELADAADLAQWRERMFAGDKINLSEHRAVLHTALRQPREAVIEVDGVNVVAQAYAALDEALAFAERVRSGEHVGHSGERIRHVVNIGIGGSDLGPKMVVEALQSYADAGVQVRFVSNVDGAHLAQTLQDLRAETTLFIIASKSFTTPETLLNAEAAKQWLLAQTGWDLDAIAPHFVAISTNLQATSAFGIDNRHVFKMFDWVGGRYSVWSTIGLPVMCAIGRAGFMQFLAGARAMDEHFLQQPWRHNVPVLLALIGVWYNNFFDAHSHAVIPYDYGMRALTEYLQQLDMESNGKNVTQQDLPVECATGPIIWGSQGVNCQHAYFQMLHQGSRLIPSDFIVPMNSHYPLGKQHQVLVANAFAQTEALMRGKTLLEAETELLQAGKDTQLAAQKVFAGNQPTTSVLVDAITPHSLGMLIAMYEHKVFVQGVIWDINSFDQWGVEYGKVLAKTIEPELAGQGDAQHDASTLALISYFREHHVSTTTAELGH
ncbi:glucose-6-phosphate isomerase [Vitreoscilla massiliensis]|uniref:Glucose-6-phosphate isomerase n=1 Tax=Vitreoscilla massiliensis TaxID=1689272 RepID=A0ABY4DXU4_9NEIS|nr:glucose-6-phosphate isomerase [Vitreoscilla massiliensis]UOO88336.1 glucose-6-phosphate isomerase [Vitreoscilla massiliensis]